MSPPFPHVCWVYDLMILPLPALVLWSLSPCSAYVGERDTRREIYVERESVCVEEKAHSAEQNIYLSTIITGSRLSFDSTTYLFGLIISA